MNPSIFIQIQMSLSLSFSNPSGDFISSDGISLVFDADSNSYAVSAPGLSSNGICQGRFLCILFTLNLQIIYLDRFPETICDETKYVKVTQHAA